MDSRRDCPVWYLPEGLSKGHFGAARCSTEVHYLPPPKTRPYCLPPDPASPPGRGGQAEQLGSVAHWLCVVSISTAWDQLVGGE